MTVTFNWTNHMHIYMQIYVSTYPNSFSNLRPVGEFSGDIHCKHGSFVKNSTFLYFPILPFSKPLPHDLPIDSGLFQCLSARRFFLRLVILPSSL